MSFFKKPKDFKHEIDTGKRLGKCLLRKSYRDPKTGVYYKNRCIIRQGRTMIGRDYNPSDDDSTPWEIDDE